MDSPIADEPMPASQANTITFGSIAAVVFCPLLSAFICETNCFAASRASISSSVLSLLTITEAIRKDTTAPTVIPRITGRKPPFGVIASSANILPGDGVATSPALNNTKVKLAATPPPITASSSNGFIST